MNYSKIKNEENSKLKGHSNYKKKDLASNNYKAPTNNCLCPGSLKPSCGTAHSKPPLNTSMVIPMCFIIQIKFNTPSSSQFSQQTTASNNGGGGGGGSTVFDTVGSTTKVSSTMPSVTTAREANSGDLGLEDSGSDGGEETMHTGFLKEWTLMLHGTKEPPYGQLSVKDPHSKLAIVKKAHNIAGPETTVPLQQQSAY